MGELDEAAAFLDSRHDFCDFQGHIVRQCSLDNAHRVGCRQAWIVEPLEELWKAFVDIEEGYSIQP